MRNRFNKCCCPDVPDGGFSCSICTFDCLTTPYVFGNRTIHVVNREHPNGEEGHFGKVTGNFHLKAPGQTATIFFDFSPEAGSEGLCSFVRFEAVGNNVLRISAGGGSLQTDLQAAPILQDIEYGSVFVLNSFCIRQRA